MREKNLCRLLQYLEVTYYGAVELWFVPGTIVSCITYWNALHGGAQYDPPIVGNYDSQLYPPWLTLPLWMDRFASALYVVALIVILCGSFVIVVVSAQRIERTKKFVLAGIVPVLLVTGLFVALFTEGKRIIERRPLDLSYELVVTGLAGYLFYQAMNGRCLSQDVDIDTQ